MIFNAKLKYNLVLLCGVVCIGYSLSQGACPESNEYLRRVGRTRFYILHEPLRRKFVTQAEAKTECESNGLKLAKIPNMLTMSVVSRELEKLGKRHFFRDTWYWIDAIFDEANQTYYWGNPEDGDVVKYSNFLFRPPRPIGIGAHISYKQEYQKELELKQCLTLALPWPWPTNDSVYGYQASFDERFCESKKSRHAMCESSDPECELKNQTVFTISERQTSYFEDGNWILGNRKYIVNWKHRTFNETEDYCKSLTLQLLTPTNKEKWLIPHLKMWSRSITNSLFWTNLKFNATSLEFFDTSGKLVGNISYFVNFTEDIDLINVNGRRKRLSLSSLKSETLFCVALSLSYEMKTQMPCPDPTSKQCTWSFIRYVPSNFNNYHAAICQHSDFAKREIAWPKVNPNDLSGVLETNDIVTGFGFKEGLSGLTLRSKVKQTFGLSWCPEGYRMQHMMRAIREKNETDIDWGKDPSKTYKSFFYYDYLETYWVVDEDHYNKNADSMCTVAYVEPSDMFSRKFKKVPCTEWHFYLCDNIDPKINDQRVFDANFTKAPNMKWNDGSQPRVYPLVQNRENPSEIVSTTNSPMATTPTSKPTQNKKNQKPKKDKKHKVFKMDRK